LRKNELKEIPKKYEFPLSLKEFRFERKQHRSDSVELKNLNFGFQNKLLK
jgi:hypothetical protein